MKTFNNVKCTERDTDTHNTYLFEQVYYFLNVILHMSFSCAELSLLSVTHVPMNTHYYV